MTQKLLTVKEVSEILDLKPARIYELTREKRFRLSRSANGNIGIPKPLCRIGSKTVETKLKQQRINA